MRKWPADRFLILAIASAALALTMVGLLQWILGSDLSQWIHVPLTFLILNLMAGGAGVAGVAVLEYRARSSGSRQKAQKG
jgi:membrane protein DedA with SNARE-associated domain